MPLDSHTTQRLDRALARRHALHTDPQTNAYRLLNRAGDGFPDLAVDRFGEVLVAHCYTAGRIASPPTALLRDIAERAGAKSIYIKHRPTEASKLAEAERRALAPETPLWGESVPELVVRENGLNYLIRPGKGLSVGLFLDMRDTRAWVRARAKGQTILNCFAYTCAFGVAALAGGAARAVNLDVSKPYLGWGKRNTELNDFAPIDQDFIFGDVFDWLKRLARAGTQFAGVILDPPSYATTKYSRFALERDYANLLALAAPLVAPGGWMLACANTHTLPEAAFRAQVRAGVNGHRARLIKLTHAPEIDFPGTTAYLKLGLIQFSKTSE
jgi:23S rRNA (cytosine1962-C5)-methyltransferase